MRPDIHVRHRTLAALRAYRWAWIGIALLLGFGLFHYVSVVHPRAERVDALQRTFLESRRRLAQVTQADSAIRRYLSAKERLQTFRQALPEERALRTLSAEIQGYIADHGIVAEDGPVRFRPDGVGDLVLVRYVLPIKLLAPYGALKAFLADLGNSPSLFCLEAFALYNRSGETAQAELELTVVTYARASLRLLGPAG